ncbi:MAG: hypothetical protein ACR2OX_00195 [Methyloligellaceae bacterium]
MRRDVRFLLSKAEIAAVAILVPVIAGAAYLWLQRGTVILLDMSMLSKYLVCF